MKVLPLTTVVFRFVDRCFSLRGSLASNPPFVACRTVER